MMNKTRFDPEEIVTLPGHGKMSLRGAVAKVMNLRSQNLEAYVLAAIFRDGDPPILDLSQIDVLAGEWGLR